MTDYTDNSRSLSKLMFIAGFTLVAFVFFNILISSVLLIFRVSITAVTPVAALVLSLGAAGYWARKDGLWALKPLLSIMALVLAVIVGSIFLAGIVPDYTYDGNSYHKTAIGMLRDGWNPVYENMEEFDSRAERSFGFVPQNVFWENHYAKAPYFFASNIYKVTGNVETGKSINLISLFALVFLAASYLLKKGRKPIFIAAFAMILFTYPVFTVQLLTNYVDLLLGTYLFMLIFCFFFFEEEGFSTAHTETLLLFFMVLCIMINIKFSSFAYAGIYCLGYYLWYIYRLRKKDLEKVFFIKFTGTAVIAVLVGVLVIGLSVYPKNLTDHGHPFYPLFGEGKVDIITSNSPAVFQELAPIERFIAATFSKADNIVQAYGTAPEFKIPFTWTGWEYEVLYIADLRISGHGLFFSGVFLISLIVLAVYYFKAARRREKGLPLTLIPLGINVILIFTMGETWWARYFPQLFLFPLFALLCLDKVHRKPARAAEMVLVLALLANNLATCHASAQFSIEYTQKTNNQYAQFEAAAQNTDGTLVLSTATFKGNFYNAFDRLPENAEYRIELKDIPDDGSDADVQFIGALAWYIEPIE